MKRDTHTLRKASLIPVAGLQKCEKFNWVSGHLVMMLMCRSAKMFDQ